MTERKASSCWRTLRGQQRSLMLGYQRIDDLAQRLALDNLRKLIEGEIDAVVAHAPLRKIVGADALGTITRPYLSTALRGAFSVTLLALEVVESCAQHCHRLGSIPVLRTVLLHHDNDAGWNVCHPHGRFGLVDVLAAGAAGAQGVYFQVGFIDGDVNVGSFRQHGDGRGGRVDAPRSFGIGDTLHAMNTGFEFELGEGPASPNFCNDLLVATHGAFTG